MAPSWITIAVSWLALCSAQADRAGFKRALETSSNLEPRVLRAAALESDIAKRGLDVALRNKILLHYVDTPSKSGLSPMAAHLSLTSGRPTLVLEEIDHLIEEIHCEENSMHVEFREAIFPEVRRVLGSKKDFLVITSHQSCNARGSRSPHLVHECEFAELSKSIKLSTKPVGWREAYHVKVDYGADERTYKHNLHDHLKKRDGLSSFIGGSGSSTLAPTLSTIPVSTVSTVATSSQVQFPTPTSTAGVNETTVTEDISHALINQQILPIPDTGALDGLSLGGASLPTGIGLTCLNCSIGGDVVLTSGSFSSPSNSSSGLLHSIESAVDFIENGFIELAANNMFAHIELSATWANTQTVGLTFPITLATIPLQPYSIPDIAVIGPMFTPRLILSVGVSANLNFTYGFQVTVPNNSTAMAVINNVNESSITGFDHTTFTALPFNATVNDIALNLSATLQPEILVGVSFLNSLDSAGAGIFLNLPTLSLAVEAVSNTDTNCNPSTNSTLVNAIESEFGNLTNIVPQVELAAGFIAQAKASIPGLPGINEQRAFTPLATTFAVPTTCLAFDKSAGGYVAATFAAAAAASSTGAASSLHDIPKTGAVALQVALIGSLMLLGPLFLI